VGESAKEIKKRKGKFEGTIYLEWASLSWRGNQRKGANMKKKEGASYRTN